MTQPLTIDRAARPFPHPPFTLPPRSTVAAKPLTVVPAPVAPLPPTAPAIDAGFEHLIRSIGQATTRMAELLEQLHEQERVIVELQGSNEALRGRAEAAEANARLHEIRAGEAALKVEQLLAQKQAGAEEHDRLKASVDTLLAMFGGVEQFALASA